MKFMTRLKESLRQIIHSNEPDEPDGSDRGDAAGRRAEFDGASDPSLATQPRPGDQPLLATLRQPTGPRLKQGTLAMSRAQRSWESSPTVWGGAPSFEGGIFDRPAENAGEGVITSAASPSPTSARGAHRRPAPRGSIESQDAPAYGDLGPSAAADAPGEAVGTSLGPALDFGQSMPSDRPY